MDYPFENLDPEVFQKFCQALLTKEFSDTQCFPVGQPDGGRDATSHILHTAKPEFIVYQIKFVRQPSTISSPRQWLVKILEEEVPKIQELIPKGAKRYVLITNVSGTAHPESGSIDKVDTILKNAIQVPAMCWWRDDLNRRLDNAWDLKWVYPELMTGPDLIRSIIEDSLTESRERRSSAIRAFVKDQFSREQEVRFKQVELQNKLLDLFIDVPAIPPQHSVPKRSQRNHYSMYRTVMRDISRQNPSGIEQDVNEEVLVHDLYRDYTTFNEEHFAVGAASLFLHPIVQMRVLKAVIEGAPGQGKSTIVQYICQVHRMRILKFDDLLQTLPWHHQNSPVRLPFRIDLRDLAIWLDKGNPFTTEENESLPSYWQKTLEAFLAAQVRHHSGGSEFTVDDLISVVKRSSTLLVFDGLDEVADIGRRKEVVDEIINGVNRLEENSLSLQAIVTSRPAAFANSPGLPEEIFPYFQLGEVTRPLIEEYTNKWLIARRLQGSEGAEVKKILRDKLGQPHIRDLARNPMQLTILLSLIHTRGSSLPDKRTSLYDNYVDLFFNREAEKSSVVRDHRDLLINVHRYLAWVLHTEAESGKNNGSINEDRLNNLLSDYLVTEGYDPVLAKQLFTGMVERVVALVSRVEGTYEFEVQPLREYFAARFLYETAPYSPTGDEKGGTKPDRFDAIARNFYWLNVARFYAGCYSKGELPSLIDCLEQLIKEGEYQLISHPRLLAATLLSDWVFTQHPRSVQEVVSLILDGIGLRYILSSNSRRVAASTPLVLPERCGREQLVTRCFEILEKELPRDYAYDIIDVIRVNAVQDEITSIWLQKTLADEGVNRTRWMEYGWLLGVLSVISTDDLRVVVSEDLQQEEKCKFLYRARRLNIIENDQRSYCTVLSLILSGDIPIRSGRKPQSVIELFNQAVSPMPYASAFRFSQPIPLAEIWLNNKRNEMFADLSGDHIQEKPDFPETRKCLNVIESARLEILKSAQEWATEISPWDNLIEQIRTNWGDQWICYTLANIGSGIKSQTETCTDCPDFLDRKTSLARRTRYARLRAGTISWWVNQFDQVQDSQDIMSILLTLITWGSSNTIVQLSQLIDETVQELSYSEWQRVHRSVEETIQFTREQANDRLIKFDPKKLSNFGNQRTVALLGTRTKAETRKVIYSRYLSKYNGDDPIILRFCQNNALDLLESGEINWHDALDVIAQSYAKGIVSERYAFHRFIRRTKNQIIPRDMAQEIALNPHRYPGYLVAAAETVCKNMVASTIVPVGKIAERDKWFNH